MAFRRAFQTAHASFVVPAIEPVVVGVEFVVVPDFVVAKAHVVAVAHFPERVVVMDAVAVIVPIVVNGRLVDVPTVVFEPVVAARTVEDAAGFVVVVAEPVVAALGVFAVGIAREAERQQQDGKKRSALHVCLLRQANGSCGGNIPIRSPDHRSPNGRRDAGSGPKGEFRRRFS